MATRFKSEQDFSCLNAAAFPLAVVDVDGGEILYFRAPEDNSDGTDQHSAVISRWVKKWIKGINAQEFISRLTSLGIALENTQIGQKNYQISYHIFQPGAAKIILLQFIPVSDAALSDDNYRWVDHLPEGIVLHRNGKILYLNAQAAAFLGVDRQKMVGKSFQSLFPKALKSQIQKRVDQWCCGESTDYIEFEVTDSSGDVKYLGERTVNIDAGGTPVSQTILNDLSVHKRWIHEKMRAQLAEEINQILKHEIKEHKVTQYELEQAKNFNMAVIESSLDMIIAENAEGNISVFNRAAEKQYGYKREELIGRSTRVLFASAQEYQRVRSALKKKKSVSTEVKNKRKNGEVFTTYLSASLLHTTDGKLLGSMGVSRDISEQKQAAEALRHSEELYRDLFDNMSDAYLMVNPKGMLVHWNKAGLELLGVPRKQAATVNFIDWLSSSDGKALVSARKQVKNSGKALKGLEFFLVNGKKERRCVQVNISPVFEGNEFIGTRELLRDITDQKSAQEEAESQAAKIQSIFESTAYMIWSVDADGRLTSFNGRYAAEYERQSGSAPRTGLKALGFSSYPKARQKKVWKDRYAQAFNGKTQRFEVAVGGKKNKVEWYQVVLNPIDTKTGEIEEISGIALSVTYKKQAEEKIKKQAAKINSIFDSTAMLIYTLDHKFRITSYNVNFAKTIAQHFDIEIQIGSNMVELLRPHMRRDLGTRLKKLYRKALDGHYARFEGPLKTKKDRIIWIETFLNPIFSENGEVTEISCMAHEITDKKIIEKQMRESLEEKEILLQEVHHRVKNNLQVISSILNLQSSYVKDSNTLNILRESQNRIKSMSFIHESLYQTSDFSSIDFSDYILSLSKNLVHSYSMTAGLVELDTRFEKVYLNLDQAIPCGLIVNELVSNALKYAFPNNRKGKLLMRIREEDNKVILLIKDDGVGVPRDFDFDGSDTLGLQLVFTLIEQLDGEVSFQSEPQKGTEYLITFDKIN